MPFEHLLTWICSQSWAMEPTKAAEIFAYLKTRAYNDNVVRNEADKINPSRERSIRQRDGKVLLIPMFGVMAQRRLPGESTGAGVPTDKVGRLIDTAVADASVKTIILQIDSPGGTVAGTRELAAKIAAAREVKPIIAQIDSMAASAAYWVASQATEVVSTPGGMVGSIGVRMMHEDISEALTSEGIKVTMLYAGKYKVEGHPFGPLDDDARSYFQSQIDADYKDFVADVAKGRGVSAKIVERGYGEGRMLLAKDAHAVGMIDRVATTEQTLARFIASPINHQRRARAAQALARKT